MVDANRVYLVKVGHLVGSEDLTYADWTARVDTPKDGRLVPVAQFYFGMSTGELATIKETEGPQQ